jgi:hypothetical protein
MGKPVHNPLAEGHPACLEGTHGNTMTCPNGGKWCLVCGAPMNDKAREIAAARNKSTKRVK